MNEASQNPLPVHPAERSIALRFDSVSFSYGTVKVLEVAAFHIHQGEFIALVGPNGSGKTTVLRLILGLLEPQKGAIEIMGRSVSRGGGLFGSASAVRDRMGYVPQQTPADRTFPITVRNVVRMGRLRPFSRKYGLEDKRAADEALAQVEITDLAERSYSGLSGGQRRRVLVARALAARPEFLILDEPTANMDTESEERLFNSLAKLKGKTSILIVTHDMDFVSPLIDRALCMGTREGTDKRYKIVQHRVETSSHSDAASEDAEAAYSEQFSPRGNWAARIIHSESIPGDKCCTTGNNGETL
jgi:zinc transport system ATP-binding protein